MDTIIKSLLPSAVGLIGSMIGGGPFGAIIGGVGIIGMVVAGLWAYNKYRNWVFERTATAEQQQAANDQATVVAANQNQAAGDALTISTSEQDKINAKKG